VSALGPGTGTTGRPRRRQARNGDGFAGREQGGEAFGGLGFVVLVVGEEFPAQAEAGEHGAGRAGVLAGDDIDGPEDGPRALGEVREIADRGGHHVKVTGQRGERGISGGISHAQSQKNPARGRIFAKEAGGLSPAEPGCRAHARNLVFP
jgi:hypothetical protein